MGVNKVDIQATYKKFVEPLLEKYPYYKINLCKGCFVSEPYSCLMFDTGKCDICGKIDEVLNPFIINKISSYGFFDHEKYVHIPTIYRSN